MAASPRVKQSPAGSTRTWIQVGPCRTRTDRWAAADGGRRARLRLGPGQRGALSIGLLSLFSENRARPGGHAGRSRVTCLRRPRRTPSARRPPPRPGGRRPRATRIPGPPSLSEAPVACAPRSRAGRSPSLDAPGSGSSPRTGAGAGRAGAGSEARLQGLVQVAAAVGVAVRVRACACACECVSKREREEGREEEERGACVLAGESAAIWRPHRS